MGVEILFGYFALMLVLGPGTVLYGALITVRRRVRLSRVKILYGWGAVSAGIVTMITGIAFTHLLWHLARFFPH